MELLAIGLLGLAGKYISERFTNNTDDEYIEDTDDTDDADNIDDTDDMSNTPNVENVKGTVTTANGFDQKKRIQETMAVQALEKKELSNDPNNKNIIPTLYNKRLYDLDSENKYLSSNKNYNNTNGETMLNLFKYTKNLMEGPTNELTSLDEQFEPMMIIDNKPNPANMGKLTLPDNWTPYNKNDDDMTYKIFNKDELIHNNMQPFFKDKGLLITEDNSRNMEQKLDIFTGSSRFYYAKTEIPNIIENYEEGFSTAFQPHMLSSYTRGTPNQVDLIQDRYFSGKEKKSDRPFDQVNVTPGVNISPYEDGKIGFHDPYMPPTKNIDELRRVDNPQVSGTFPTIKGTSGEGGKYGTIGNVVNRKPTTFGELDKNYTVLPTISTVQKPTDTGNFNFDKSHRGDVETFEQGVLGPGAQEAGISIDHFGKVRDPFKTTLAGLEQSITGSGTNQNLPNLDKGSYNNYITQRSTANSTYTGGLGNNTNGTGIVSEYQPIATQRLTTNANFTGSMGNNTNGAGTMSEYQPMTTQRLTTNAHFTGSMGNNTNGFGDMSEYQPMSTQRVNTNSRYTGAMGNNTNGLGEMSEYQPMSTQRVNTNSRYTGAMGNNTNGFGEMSEYQPMSTQRVNTNSTYTGAMGNNTNGFGDMSEYQPMSTQRVNTNSTYTGAMGNNTNGFGDMSTYQAMSTQRVNTNSTYTGAMGNNTNGFGDMSEYQATSTQRVNTNSNYAGGMGNNTNGLGEVSLYQATPTNRIMSNTLQGLPVSQIGGNGHHSTVTTPMVTQRQEQNTSYAGPQAGANNVNATSTGSGERNMYIRDNKQNLLSRNEPTPVNAYQPPNITTNGEVVLKNLPSTMMSSTGFIPSGDYLEFNANLKNIPIPTTYPNYYPPDMEFNNPYINNSLYKAKQEYVINNNIENSFNQFSRDYLK